VLHCEKPLVYYTWSTGNVILTAAYLTYSRIL
jgi:hypothetical protein